MEELIAKRYVKALLSETDVAFMKDITLLFDTLASSFNDAKFVNIMTNTDISKEDKTTLLLEVVKVAESEKVNNFVKLLVENKRVDIIPAIAEELRKNLANVEKRYNGVVFSDTEIETNVLDDLSNGLSEKYDSKILLSFEKTDFDGIKVEVEDLGIEIDFSKTRINKQIIEHIIKAI
jgi:F-type H+-transporting ATPase subunit delta